MSQMCKGRRLKLSPARKLVMEWLYHAKKVPSLPTARCCNLAPLAAARASLANAPSWTAVFMRAYALLARRHPELRQALIPWPRPHLYEHPRSDCAVLIEREWQGERIVLGAKIRAPENQSLTAIAEHLRNLSQRPVEEISAFRQLLRVGQLPALLRRFIFCRSLYLSGATRAKRLGTFTMSTLGNLGAEQMHPLTMHTTYLTFGPISASGETVVKVIYDHRVMDDRCVARILSDLEQTLNTEMAAELRGLRSAAA